MFSEPIHSPLQKITLELLDEKGVELWVKRDDLIHEEISGNKWRKLKFNVLKAKSQNKKLIITLGGAYSNHIAATAALGYELGIKTKGIIRGEELKGDNYMLSQAKSFGMELEFVSREYYRERHEQWFKKELLERHAESYFIPEGGANYYGIQGCAEIIIEIPIEFDCIFTAAGTGTTAAGLATGLTDAQMVYAVSALKGEFLKREIEELLYSAFMERDFASELMNRVSVITDYHFGGYAKTTQVLIDFLGEFYHQTGIKLDPIYTGKMMFAILDLIKMDSFEKGSKIVALHTGGLQGIRGIENQVGQIIYS